MVLLRSNERHIDLAEMDHATGKYTMLPGGQSKNGARRDTCGSFSFLSGVFVALYCFEKALFLRIGEACLALGDDLVVHIQGIEPTQELIAQRARLDRTLIVEKAGSEITRLHYVYDLSGQFPDDPTPFIDDEGFDFGLWISNITKSPERQQVLLGSDA